MCFAHKPGKIKKQNTLKNSVSFIRYGFPKRRGSNEDIAI